MGLFMAIPVTAGAALIKFDTTPPQGDPVSDYYKISDGVYFTPGFSGNFPTATMDIWSFDSGATFVAVPVLTDALPLTGGSGDFYMHFVNPVTSVSFDSGMWDGLNGNVDIYDPSNNLLGSFPNAGLDVYHFDFGSNVIGMIYFDSSGDENGASITNLSFTPVSVPEPGTLLLLGCGLVGLGSFRKVRSRG
jgi:hypothetical protein